MSALKAVLALALAYNAQTQPAPIKSDVLGCSELGRCGQIFDDYSTGYHGAIAAVCFAKHSKRDAGAITLTEIITNYAGSNVAHGGNRSSNRNGQSCFDLQPAEFITQVEAEIQPDTKHGPTRDTLYSLRFTVNTGRQSLWFGRAARSPIGKKSLIVKIEAPNNRSHVIAIHGYGWESNATSPIHGLGVYWGYGGGAGVWAPVKSCVGCGSWSFEFDYGTDRTHSTDTRVTRTWTMAVTAEMSYAFKGFSAGLSISNTFSSEVMHDTKDSFQVTTMEKKTFTCDKTNLYQWQMTSNFDDPVTPVTTFTSYMVCTDNFEPCCLPGTFSKDPSICDLKPEAPSNCPKPSRSLYV